MAGLTRYARLLPGRAKAECTLTGAHYRAGVTVDAVLDFRARELGVTEPHVVMATLKPGDPLDPYDPPSGLPRQFEAAVGRSVDSLLGRVPDEYSGARDARLDMAGSMVRRLVTRQAKTTMCAAGVSQLVVDPAGDVYPCWMLAGNAEFRMGNVRHDGLFDEQGKRLLAQFERNTRACHPDCSQCAARGVCNLCLGNNYNSTGSAERPDLRFCALVRASLRTTLLRLAERRSTGETPRAGSGRPRVPGATHAEC